MQRAKCREGLNEEQLQMLKAEVSRDFIRHPPRDLGLAEVMTPYSADSGEARGPP